MTDFNTFEWNNGMRRMSDFHQFLYDIRMDMSYMNMELDTVWSKMQATPNKKILQIALDVYKDSRLMREKYVIQTTNDRPIKKDKIRGGFNNWARFNKWIHYDLSEKGMQLFETLNRAKNCTVFMDMDTFEIDWDRTFKYVVHSLQQAQIRPQQLAMIAQFDPEWAHSDEIKEMVIVEKLRRTYLSGEGVDEIYV